MSEFIAGNFHQTLKRFNISARQLSDVSGASTSQLSEFRNGKRNLSTAQLERVMVAMEELAPGSRRHFCMLLAGENPEGLASQIEFLSSQELAVLLNSVADRIVKKSSHQLVGTLT